MKAQESSKKGDVTRAQAARNTGVRIAVSTRTGLRPMRSARKPTGTALMSAPMAGIALKTPMNSG